MAKYFAGNRIIGPFEYQEDNTLISYQIVENWHNTGRSHTARCKISSVLSGSHEKGIEVTEIESFNTHIESTLGVKGVVSLKSHVEKSYSIQFTLSKKEACADIFNIPAPGCGCNIATLYQLVRDFQFTTKKERLFRKPLVTSHSLRELTQQYDLRLEFDPEDPTCPCKEIDATIDSEILVLRIGKLSLRIDAFLNAKQQLVTKIGDSLFSIEKQKLINGPINVELEKFPKEFQVISGIKQDIVVAEVEIEKEFQLTDLDIHTQGFNMATEGNTDSFLQDSQIDKNNI